MSWGRFVHRWRWPVAAASVLAFIGLALVARSGGHLYESQSVSTEAGRVQDLRKEELPRQPDRTGFVLVFSSPSLSVADPSFRSAMDQALAPLRSDSRVFSVTTAYNDAARSMISRDGRSALASVTLNENSDKADTDYPRLRGLVHSDQLSVVATGGPALEDDFNRLTDEGLSRSQRVALPLSVLILVLAFGGIAAALLPVGIGVLAITAATAGSLVLSRYWQVSPSSPELISLLGLGLAIDYSLFVVTRFREELARDLNVGSALAATTATASRSITFRA